MFVFIIGVIYPHALKRLHTILKRDRVIQYIESNIRAPVLLNLLSSSRKKTIKLSANLAFYLPFYKSFNKFNIGTKHADKSWSTLKHIL